MLSDILAERPHWEFTIPDDQEARIVLVELRLDLDSILPQLVQGSDDWVSCRVAGWHTTHWIIGARFGKSDGRAAHVVMCLPRSSWTKEEVQEEVRRLLRRIGAKVDNVLVGSTSTIPTGTLHAQRDDRR